MSNSDEIRAKRLARLAAVGGGNSNSSSTSNVNASTNNSTSTIAESTSSPTASPNVAATTPSKKVIPTQGPPLSEEQQLSNWLKKEIESIFDATINPEHKNKGLIFLSNLAGELGDYEEAILTEDHLEAIFMEILTDLGLPETYKSPIEYLYSVYHRSYGIKRILPVKSVLYSSKIAIINSIIKFSSSYGLISFQVPDMFLQNDLGSSIQLFIKKAHDLTPFLIDIINTSIEQESLLDILNIFLPSLSSQLYKLNLNDRRYAEVLSLFETFVNIKPVAAIFSQVAGFQPPSRKNALDFEHKTLLGPLLRLSPLNEAVSVYYFSENVRSVPPTQLNSLFDSVQNEYNVLSGRLFYIVDKLIRGSVQTREDLLVWLAELVNLSHLRRGSHADFSKLPSDSIMFNISIILIKLSLPFLDFPSYSKISKIDVNYFAKSRLIDIHDESRVNSTIQEADEYYKNSEESEAPNFISTCFNLTLTYLHYGMGGVYVHFDRLRNQIKQYTERIEMIESNRVPPGTNPMMANLLRQQLPKLNKDLNGLLATRNSITAIFSYRPLQLEIFDFIVGSTTFITKLIDPTHKFPQQKLSIPIYKITNVSQLDDHDFLKTKTPEPWKYYPEFMLEGIINYCKFSTLFRGCPLVQNFEKLSLYVEFAIVLLRCPELIGNPHMKANLVELLYVGSIPMMNGEPGFIAPVFSSNNLVADNILYSLLDFYVMVEKTGASSQFYDKFNSRYYISVILEELWKNPVYRGQLTDYSKNNVDFFIRFIARMLNDTTYLLDETFNELEKIHDYQLEIRNRQQGSQNEDLGTDEELAGKLATAERTAKSYMGLSNKTMELFKLFTKEVPQGFVLPEIVDRLAGMLDYNLSIMVGPKCSNLKVEAPEKYEFSPKKILSDLCEIYANLASQDKFVIAVSRDGRSFNLSYFQKAEKILTTKTYVDPKIIKALINFAQKAELQRLEDEDEEMELGEIPDEFLDPLMFTLMEDPVKLPSSKVSIDRSTIKAHLLSDGTDPFNRVPLKLEDVVDDIELKEKIENFKREKKAERVAAKMEDVEMSEA
ncbi:ubiquitin elongating factor core-domain-containing protein [Scheffersomyces xylosifermentans]|uniref:ubiquitin elongating factor core-domain-containing protein n=1 Tax=Scheffersomyces xylosifermentans TaxID=1304137 RepID=UPI00315CD738